MSRSLLVSVFVCCLVVPVRSQDVAERLDAVLTAAHARGEFDGVVLVAQGERTVYRRSFGVANREWGVPHGLDTVFPIASVSKQITAVLALRMVDAGLIDLERPVTDYVSRLPASWAPGLKVVHLLQHASGLPTLAEMGLGGDRGEEATFWKGLLGTAPTTTPGTRFRYTNTDYLLLQAVLCEVARAPFPRLVEERVLDPLGMTSTAVLAPGKSVKRLATRYCSREGGLGVVLKDDIHRLGAAAGMVSTAEDLLRLDRGLSRDGFLSAASRRRLDTPREDLGYVALGSWVYRKPVGERKVLLSERQGGVEGATALNVRALEDDWTLIVLSNRSVPGLFGLSSSKGLAHDLVEIAAGMGKGTPAAPHPLVGTWEVTLRHGEGQESGTTLVVDEAADGRLKGLFYGTGFSAGYLRDVDGVPTLAFRTSDGTGPYFSSGHLVGDRIEGLTMSTSRDFLCPWTARRR